MRMKADTEGMAKIRLKGVHQTTVRTLDARSTSFQVGCSCGHFGPVRTSPAGADEDGAGHSA
jgi:hypothetical protein